MPLFRAKFASNSAFRNPIFRWESYKGSVWESVKKSSRVCTQDGPRDWISRLDLATSKSPKLAHVWSMQGSWRVTPAVALQDKTSSLARQLARDSNSRLIPITSSSHQDTLFGFNWLFAFHTHLTINTLIPTKCRELPERILREKP